MKKKRSPLSIRKLETLAREFDDGREPRFGVAPASVRRQHDAVLRRAKRRRGRPRIGGGAQRVQITMESSLLRAADRFARANGLSRSELIANCLTPVIRRKSA